MRRLESSLFYAFLAVLVWAPLPFASNRLWGVALLAVLVAALLALWLLLLCFGKVQIEASVWRRARLPLILLVLVQLWVFCQIVPLPRSIVEILSPQAFDWHIRTGWISLSLDPQSSKHYLLRGFTYTGAFFLALVLVNSVERVKSLLQVLVFSGTMQAAYAVYMVLSGLELGFFVEKYTGRGVATGTYVNRNHLAGYLVMCLSAGVGLLLSQMSRSTALSWKERGRRWLVLLLSSKIRLRVYLAVMVVALVLTRARMGNIAFFASLSFAGIVAMYTGRRFSGKVFAFLVSLIVVDLLILGKWFGLNKLLVRLQETHPDAEARVWSNAYSLDYLAHFPLTGSGGGSFYSVFPNFQGPESAGYHVHAHNDYLEFATELGLPVTMVLVGVVVLALLAAINCQRYRHSALLKGAGFAATMTIAWAALHSLTDFNLQIPANAITFVTILALAFICRELPSSAGSSKL